MKKLIPSVLLFTSFATHSQVSPDVTRGLMSALNPNEDMNCVAAIKPKIKKGEVKISYPCEVIPTPEKAESEKITFFERKNQPQTDDLIIRHRSSEKEKDFTLKFRRPSDGTPMELDEGMYNTLKAKDDLKEVNFKCEADVTYGETASKVNESCSLATPTDFYTPDHDTFMRMVNKTVPTNRNELVSYEINSVSWNLPSSQFKKGISVEKWLLEKKGKTLCILEVSGKFEVPKGGTLDDTIKTSMAALLTTFANLKPDSTQGNKTGRALSFLKAN